MEMSTGLMKGGVGVEIRRVVSTIHLLATGKEGLQLSSWICR